MKEFNLPINSIFKGLYPSKVFSKKIISLSECHNLEPVKDDYDLHELMIDLNATGYAWGTPASSSPEMGSNVWEDNQEYVWEDHGSDIWQDS